MYKMTIQVPGGTMEVPGQTQAEVIKAASFFLSLPLVCPVDDTPTRLSYRKLKFDNYGLASTGYPTYYFDFGIPTDGGEEFFAGKYDAKAERTVQRWYYYDMQQQRAVVMWEDGKLTEAGQQARDGKPNSKEAIAQHTDGPDELVGYAESVLQGLALKPAGYASQLIELRKQVSLLGNEMYPTRWYEVCTRNVQRLTNGKCSNLDDLTAEELTRMIAGLNRAKEAVAA